MEEKSKRRQSALGIASFSIMIFTLILFIVYHFGGTFLYRIEYPIKVEVNLGLPLLFSPLIGFILGVWGLTRKGSRKELAIIGIVLSIISMCGVLWVFRLIAK
jgi:hypothetical protein